MRGVIGDVLALSAAELSTHNVKLESRMPDGRWWSMSMPT